MKRNRRHNKQIRLISEAIDDDPKMFGDKVNPSGQAPIDQLITHVQKNMIKWDWNSNQFVKAMRDVYHAAGKPIPRSREELVQQLQKDSEQDPKLLNQLMTSLGGMTRRNFMGVTAGAGAGFATGMIDLKGPEKSKAADWDGTLKPGQHYRVTYRNHRNQTLVFDDLIFDAMGGQMYWFQNPKKARYSAARGASGDWHARSAEQQKKYDLQEIKQRQQHIQYLQAVLAGKKPFQIRRQWGVVNGRYTEMGPPVPKYVKPNWPKTIERLKRRIQFQQYPLERLMQRIGQPYQDPKAPEQRKFAYLTLQVEAVVDITPVGQTPAAPKPAPEAQPKKRFGLF